MIQVFQGGVSSCDRHTVQRLRRFHVQYCSVLIDIILPHIVELNHEVEVRIDPDWIGKSKPPSKFTSLLRELRRLTVEVPVAGKHGVTEALPIFHSVIPTTNGLDAGTAKATVRADCKEAIDRVHEIKKCLAGWMFHKWRQVDHYSERTAQTLMEGFETDAALMARFSVFNVRTMTIQAEFVDNDNFLEEMAADMDLDEDFNDGDADVAFDFAGAVDQLEDTLRTKDDLSDAERSGKSRRTGFSASTGNSTNAEVNEERLAFQHKDRAKKNIELTKSNADLSAAVNDQQKQMEEQAKVIAKMEALLASSGTRLSPNDVVITNDHTACFDRMRPPSNGVVRMRPPSNDNTTNNTNPPSNNESAPKFDLSQEEEDLMVAQGV